MQGFLTGPMTISSTECVKQNSLLTFSRNSMATTVYLRVSTGTFQPRSLSRGHSFEVSKYDGKNEVYPDLIQGQR
jgi:deoxyadenosine/deoxycytidine kinase